MSAPVRLCCGQPHFEVMCPDGKVMCEICFGRFDVDDLAFALDPDFEGQRENVCEACANSPTKGTP